jgi:hypothetical protein
VGRLWCPEFIPNIEKFLAVTIFKMATQIQHCPISSKFDMWVDNWFPPLRSVEIFRCRESIQVIIIYLRMKSRWNRTMLNLCGIVAIGKKFSMSGINSRHHYLPTYKIFILDIEKFLAVTIFKMAAQIQHCPISSKFDMWVRDWEEFFVTFRTN